LGSATAARVGRLLVSADWHAKNPAATLEWIRRAERTTFRSAVAQLVAVGRHNTLARLSQIRAPTLVLTGDADRLVPPQNSEVLARAIPGARLHTLAGAGHAFPLEREEETVRALTQHFLEAESHAPRSVA